MKLLLRRELHKETKGLLLREEVTTFLLHARIEVTPQELALIQTFWLGGKELFRWRPPESKTDHTIAINVRGLINEGKDMHFADFAEMLNAEHEIRENTERIANLVNRAATFQEEQVFEF